MMKQAHDFLMNDPQDSWGARAYLGARGFNQQTAERFKLGVSPLYGGSVTIPYLNPDGTVRQLRYRRLLPDGERKYHTPSGSGVHLFNVVATMRPKVWITEGEFDAMSLEQIGFPTAGVPGVLTFKRSWRFLFADCEKVTLVFDPDERGQDAASKVARELVMLVPSIRNVELPGADVNELLARDPDRLRRLVA